MSPTSRAPNPPFVSLAQQRRADALGMWIFLGTEVLLFGGLFTGYLVYRLAYPQAFAAASGHLDIVLGTLNTVLLLSSSFTMALAVRAVQGGRALMLRLNLVITALLGMVFLGIKALEWRHEYQESLVPLRGLTFHFEGADPAQAQMFFNLYFTMTGLHALHLLAGIGIVLVMLGLSFRSGSPFLAYRVENAGLYWHLVDVIWVFVFPIFYLVERHG